uniref:Hypotheticial protein n=1 Tax=Schistosoma japonicum TaxID=6182 RepID=C1L4F2_SCHJA|nr:hypotheticial protein [Schistosoma japonicum]
MISSVLILVLLFHCTFKTEGLKDNSDSSSLSADKRMVYWKRFYNPSNEIPYPGEERYIFDRPRLRSRHYRHPIFAEAPFDTYDQSRK